MDYFSGTCEDDVLGNDSPAADVGPSYSPAHRSGKDGGHEVVVELRVVFEFARSLFVRLRRRFPFVRGFPGERAPAADHVLYGEGVVEVVVLAVIQLLGHHPVDEARQ